MNEFEIRDELRQKRTNIKSFKELVAFLRDVKNNYNVGYGAVPRAIAQACVAVGRFLADVFGITGFQAGCVMWDFIRDWNHTNNKCGLKIIDYDLMLYPQYEYNYDKTISGEVWDALQKEAKKNLEQVSQGRSAHPNVIAHWQSIVGGVVPFGYEVR